MVSGLKNALASSAPLSGRPLTSWKCTDALADASAQFEETGEMFVPTKSWATRVGSGPRPRALQRCLLSLSHP